LGAERNKAAHRVFSVSHLARAFDIKPWKMSTFAFHGKELWELFALYSSFVTSYVAIVGNTGVTERVYYSNSMFGTLGAAALRPASWGVPPQTRHIHLYAGGAPGLGEQQHQLGTQAVRARGGPRPLPPSSQNL